MQKPYDYSMIRSFIEKYLPQGFENIHRQDPMLVDLEKKLSHNRQFFYVGDLLQMKILFTSNGSQDIIGVEPDRFDLSTFITRTHPEDQARYSQARSKVIKLGYDLLIRKKGDCLLSACFRQRNPTSHFINLLFQAYSFYSEVPRRTVFTLLLLTDLSSFKISKHGYHYYAGYDLSLFRYPDGELLKTGHIFSDREFEILKMIAAGMGSEQIADKLSISPNTVNTHRRNLLKKTNNSTTHELVIALQESGIL